MNKIPWIAERIIKKISDENSIDEDFLKEQILNSE